MTCETCVYRAVCLPGEPPLRDECDGRPWRCAGCDRDAGPEWRERRARCGVLERCGLELPCGPWREWESAWARAEATA